MSSGVVGAIATHPQAAYNAAQTARSVKNQEIGRWARYSGLLSGVAYLVCGIAAIFEIVGIGVYGIIVAFPILFNEVPWRWWIMGLSFLQNYYLRAAIYFALALPTFAGKSIMILAGVLLFITLILYAIAGYKGEKGEDVPIDAPRPGQGIV